MALLFGERACLYGPESGLKLGTSHKMLNVSNEPGYRRDSRMYITFDLNQ
jgi:hypothetical protein